MERIITVHLKPNARETKIIEWLDEDTVKAAVTAAPEKGKANAALIDLMATELKTAKSNIDIIRGTTTRMKQLEIKTPT